MAFSVLSTGLFLTLTTRSQLFFLSCLFSSLLGKGFPFQIGDSFLFTLLSEESLTLFPELDCSLSSGFFKCSFLSEGSAAIQFSDTAFSEKLASLGSCQTTFLSFSSSLLSKLAALSFCSFACSKGCCLTCGFGLLPGGLSSPLGSDCLSALSLGSSLTSKCLSSSLAS